jgi:hypothetical protein
MVSENPKSPPFQSLASLIKDLLSEAAHAPRLFLDLAKIERYIAESYKTER